MKNPTASAGFEPANFGTKGQQAIKNVSNVFFLEATLFNTCINGHSVLADNSVLLTAIVSIGNKSIVRSFMDRNCLGILK